MRQEEYPLFVSKKYHVESERRVVDKSEFSHKKNSGRLWLNFILPRRTSLARTREILRRVQIIITPIPPVVFLKEKSRENSFLEVFVFVKCLCQDVNSQSNVILRKKCSPSSVCTKKKFPIPRIKFRETEEEGNTVQINPEAIVVGRGKGEPTRKNSTTNEDQKKISVADLLLQIS